MFKGKAGAYSGDTLGKYPGLTFKHCSSQEMLAKDRQSSLLLTLTNYGYKKFFSSRPWGQCHKTFYGRKFRIFIISQSVCSWQDFPAESIDRGQGQEPTLEWSTSKLFHLGRLLPYPQNTIQSWKGLPGVNTKA
jgi:hypothetical protein